MDLKSLIRDIPDFPKKGIVFKDITTLLADPAGFKAAVDLMADHYRDQHIAKVLGIESRGFIFGGALAYLLNASFIPLRKPGKLPYKSITESYSLEYGTNTLEIHEDSITAGDRVLIVDDLLATGGTAKAAINLVERLNGKIVGVDFLIELGFLEGRKKLKGYPVNSYLKY